MSVQKDTLVVEIFVRQYSLQTLLNNIPIDQVELRRPAYGATELGLYLEVIITAVAASPVLVQLIKSIESLRSRNVIKKICIKKDGDILIEDANIEDIIRVLEKLKESSNVS